MTYDTDKLQGGLIAEYERLFAGIKDQPMKILEVGVLRGGSILWMLDFFPNATIYGIDIKLPDIRHERLTLIEANQNDTLKLQEIAKIGFDLVIDDGCHFPKETQNTFNVFWPAAKRYIIEDWDAAFRNHARYSGLEQVITGIISNINKLSIGDIEISCKKKSFAYFKKI